MKTVHHLLGITLIFTSLLVACSGDSGGGGGGDREEETTSGGSDGGTSGGSTGGSSGGTTGGGSTAQFDVILDSELTSAEEVSLKNSIDLLEALRIDGSKISGFRQIFGGTRSSNVVSYLERRVNYLISEFTDLESRLVFPPDIRAFNLQVFAINPSSYLWYIDEYNFGDVNFIINNRPRSINSSRFGLVKLGDIFTRSDAITQAITLVHEARHSDCPGGALLSDIVAFNNTGTPPQNKKCGQLHSSCSGNSCDSFAWGPYAIDYIYSLTIFETCSSCTETQKLQALSNANQVQGAAYDINGTMNGVYGPPNMSNSTQVKDDL